MNYLYIIQNFVFIEVFYIVRDPYYWRRDNSVFFLNHFPALPRGRRRNGCHKHIPDILYICIRGTQLPYIFTTNISDASPTQQELLHSLQNVIHHLLSNMNIIYIYK